MRPSRLADIIYWSAVDQQLITGGTPVTISFQVAGRPAIMHAADNADYRHYWVGAEIDLGSRSIAAERKGDGPEWSWRGDYTDAELVAATLLLQDILQE